MTSLYALEAGAKKVWACEVSEMLYHICNDVLESNGAKEKVVLFNEMSTNLKVPEMIPERYLFLYSLPLRFIIKVFLF